MYSVLKVGGSIIKVSKHLISYLVEAPVDALVVPGGGPFARTVRRYANQLDDTAAHWMAVLAMNQYGFYLSTPGARVTEEIMTYERGISILLPFKMLFETDPLPHSWDASSDSIAAWIASQVNANLIIATDVDGIVFDNELVSRIEAHNLKVETCVDAYLPRLLDEHHLDCTIVNGRYFQRVLDALQQRQTIGTTIIGRK